MLGIRRAFLKLKSRVDVLGVLADDDEVEIVAQVAGAFVRPDRPHQRVKVESLAQGNVDAAKSTSDWSRDRALERDRVLADRLQDVIGQRGPELCNRGLARLLDVPIELDPGGLEHANRRLADLRTDAVPRDQRYGVPSQPV